METGGTRRSDVHAGPFPDGFEALKDGDVGCAVGRRCGRHGSRSPWIVGSGEEGAERRVRAVQNRRSERIFTV